MMNTTKEIKEFYEDNLIDELNEARSEIIKDGYNEDTYTTLRALHRTLSCMVANEHHFGAWYDENKNK